MLSRCAVVIATLSTHLRWGRWRRKEKNGERRNGTGGGGAKMKRVTGRRRRRWRREGISERKEKMKTEGRKMRAEEADW